MSGQKEKQVRWFRRLRQWINDRWTREIQEIPEEGANCEFDCRKLECRDGDVGACKIRLRQNTEEIERWERQEWQQKLAEVFCELKELRAKLELLQEIVATLKADRNH